MRAAFAEIDITPKLPADKPGWIVKILATSVDDPIMAHVAVLESDGGVRVAIISLDVLSVRWPIVEGIRREAEKAGIPSGNVLVAATHNHTGPPVSAPGLATKDFAYIEEMIAKVGRAIADAVQNLQAVELFIGSTIESRISFIRRAIMKDGSVKTHAAPGSDIRCLEDVIDPQVGVIAADDLQGNLLGVIVNFTCHPTHNGGEPRFSSGWPGVLARTIKEKNLGPDVVTVFLNGALGDAHHSNPMNCDPPLTDNQSKVHLGATLAETVVKTFPTLPLVKSLSLAFARKTIELPLRDIDGPLGVNMKNRQRFAPDHVYETLIAKLREKKEKRPKIPGEVQAIRLTSDTALVTLPAEAFTAIGLEIKSRSPFKNTFVVGVANGIVGYVPTEKAFERGGYECTLSMGSKLDPSAARLLTEAAIEMLNAVADKSATTTPSGHRTV